MGKDRRWQQTLWDIQKRWGEKAVGPLANSIEKPQASQPAFRRWMLL